VFATLIGTAIVPANASAANTTIRIRADEPAPDEVVGEHRSDGASAGVAGRELQRASAG
jgi:hypothetical protein